MSETPRTDESVDNCAHYQALCDMVEAEFSRQLERELNAANANIKAMREVINEIYDSFADEPQSDSSWLLDDRQLTALSKIKPFIK